MKVKCRPEDFRVEERTAFTLDGGPFALYRLTKRGLGTPEALEAVVRRWHIPRQRIAVGGLKDRHAVTLQHMTIRGGPRRNLAQTNFELTYLGQCSRPFSSKDIVCNAFQITVRDLLEAEAIAAGQSLQQISFEGLPNYFDAQRFGSRGQSGDFIARPWCLGDYERTLWLILADPQSGGSPAEHRQRRLIRQHWGTWEQLARELRRCRWQGVLAHLASKPNDFRGALARVPSDLRSLYLAAMQSHLWNLMLAQAIRERLPDERRLEIQAAGQSLPFPSRLEQKELELFRSLDVPLPCARSRKTLGPWLEIAERAAGTLGLSVRQLRVKYPRDSFFSKGVRSAFVFPTQVDWRVEADELHEGRKKLAICFELPRGAYATIVLRRLAARPRPEG